MTLVDFNIDKCNDIMLMKSEDLCGKKVLVRCDYNVPLDNDGNIVDDILIVESLPIVRHLVNCRAKVILCSHYGKYSDNIDNDKNIAFFVMQKVANRLTELLCEDVEVPFPYVQFVDDRDVVGEDTFVAVNSLENGHVLMMQNTRLLEADEKNDIEFSKKLASLCDIFVFNAFGIANQKNSSTIGLMKYLKGNQIFVGESIKINVNLLKNFNYEKGIVAIFVGSELEDKFKAIIKLIRKGKLQKLVILGKMTLPFLKHKGYDVGAYNVTDSLEKYNNDIDNARHIISLCQSYKVRLILPKDLYCIDTSIDNNMLKTFKLFEFKNGKRGITNSKYAGLCIGPNTFADFEKIIKSLAKKKPVLIYGSFDDKEIYDFANVSIDSLYQVLLFANINIYALSDDGVFDINTVKSKLIESGQGEQIKAQLHICPSGEAAFDYLSVANLPVLEYIMLKNNGFIKLFFDYLSFEDSIIYGLTGSIILDLLFSFLLIPLSWLWKKLKLFIGVIKRMYKKLKKGSNK